MNWFRKDRVEIREGEEIWNELKRKIWETQHRGRQNDVGTLADIILESFRDKAAEDLKAFPSDSRLPICSLYHHLVNTAGIAVCFAIDRGYDKSMRDKIRVSSLLHDIGKLKELGKGVEHVEDTERKVEELLSRIDWLEDADKRYIKRLTVKHHAASYYGKYKADAMEERLISKADSVSSASDRRYEVEWKDSEVESKDAIFPHILKFGDGEEVVLGRKGREKVEDVAWYSKNMPFYDEIVEGGVIVGDYPVFEGKIGLLALDIRGIQGFIKEAVKLNALRGGSAIVEEALETAKDVISGKISPEAVLFARGGNLASFLPFNKELQEEIKKEIEERIKIVSKGGLKVAIAVDDYDIDRVAKSFDEVLKDIFGKVEEEKSKPLLLETEEVIEPARSGEVCPYCFDRKNSPGYKDGESEICEVCYEKIGRGRKEKWEELYEEYTESVVEELGLTPPNELSQIGDNIAVLLIDGNMMGQMFVQTMTPAEYSFKSEVFDSEFKEVLKETIEKFSKEHKILVVHKGEIESLEFMGLDVLYAGGDDVLIIMNAKGALGFAKELVNKVAERFKFKSRLFSTPTVTISAGIAIADSKFPIYFLIDKAEEALEEAKKAFRKEVKLNNLKLFERPEGAISFASVSGAMPSEENHTFVLGEERGKVERIVEYVERVNLKDYPRSLISLLINCGEGKEERLNLIKHLYSRLGEKELFGRASDALGGDRSALDLCEELCSIVGEGGKVWESLKAVIPMVWAGDKE